MQNTNKSFPLRLWLILTEASAAASVAILPYATTMNEKGLAKANEAMLKAGKKPLTTGRIVLSSLLNGHLTFGLAAGLGLRLARSMGMGAPKLEAWLEGKKPEVKPAQVGGYVARGVGAALLIVLLDKTLFRKVAREFEKAGVLEMAPWKALLACFYGGIAEEVLMRLGLQTLLAAGLKRLQADKALPPAGKTMWPAILVANLAFGAGHLPATAQVIKLSPLVILRALLLNGIGGVVFGQLYWKKGLEAAMIAHASADVVLHVGGSLLNRKEK
ncbi:MAG TPA: CPBP family intramembrane glutamic endopeptidase [Chloroflexia bacterium]|nr:CPBP family intramembrane glutamic endopeptidase [Chloroflexia bacterium]